MEWILGNWEMVMIGVLVIDKVVALSPSKMDDLLWSSIKKVLLGAKALKGKK
tara:strand:+ start:1042 stop:1197 length:156 start_codon:yes stop_codon:yes gene_type:complete